MGEDKSGAKVYVPKHVEFTSVEGEFVLVDLKRGTYFGLDEIASRAWELLRQNGSVDMTLAVMTNEYVVSPEVIRKDILELVQKLETKGLIDLRWD